MTDMHHQLSTWRDTLQKELTALEEQARTLAAAIAEKRGKIEAINRLIGGSSQTTVDLAASAEDSADDAAFTPVEAYWKPMLETLLEMGGRGRRLKVIEAVGRKMKGILTSADYERVSSGAIRWENRAAWQAVPMRSNGLIKSKKDSPRGIWEITDAGRQWLADHS